jgi:hypothetical protein
MLIQNKMPVLFLKILKIFVIYKIIIADKLGILLKHTINAAIINTAFMASVN